MPKCTVHATRSVYTYHTCMISDTNVYVHSVYTVHECDLLKVTSSNVRILHLTKVDKAIIMTTIRLNEPIHIYSESESVCVGRGCCIP